VSAQLILHPLLTWSEIQAWCEQHGMVIEAHFGVRRGEPIAHFVAKPEELEELPMLLRRQAE
jgi:diketogulonate reductase-like aldo/keto reductase